MAGLVPAIHAFFSLRPRHQDVDARHKAGHDNLWYCRFAKDMSRARG
jgi:hypothetical protein